MRLLAKFRQKEVRTQVGVSRRGQAGDIWEVEGTGEVPEKEGDQEQALAWPKGWLGLWSAHP